MSDMPELFWSESEQAVMRKDRESGYYIVDSPSARGWFPGALPEDAVRLVPEPTQYVCAADKHAEGQSPCPYCVPAESR
jgi:hypothetical protein